MTLVRRLLFTGYLLAALMLLAGNSIAANTDKLIKIDGSSTVYPITEAVAEEFGLKDRTAKITVGVSGTGGGFKKFCNGEIDISDASRPIKSIEKELCAKKGIEYVELPVAYDALSVVIHPKNSWAKTMTTADLKKIWEPAANKKIVKWNQINPNWPDKKLYLFGPGVDSGTFDYFTEAIVGKSQASRGDFTSSEDDNVLVQGVSHNMYGLGFFGMAYYEENQDKLAAVAIDNGAGGVLPSVDNVVNGTYKPLARPLFIYVNTATLKTKPILNQFIKFYLDNSSDLASEVGYVQLPPAVFKDAISRYQGALK